MAYYQYIINILPLDVSYRRHRHVICLRFVRSSPSHGVPGPAKSGFLRLLIEVVLFMDVGPFNFWLIYNHSELPEGWNYPLQLPFTTQSQTCSYILTRRTDHS